MAAVAQIAPPAAAAAPGVTLARRVDDPVGPLAARLLAGLQRAGVRFVADNAQALRAGRASLYGLHTPDGGGGALIVGVQGEGEGRRLVVLAAAGVRILTRIMLAALDGLGRAERCRVIEATVWSRRLMCVMTRLGWRLRAFSSGRGGDPFWILERPAGGIDRASPAAPGLPATPPAAASLEGVANGF